VRSGPLKPERPRELSCAFLLVGLALGVRGMLYVMDVEEASGRHIDTSHNMYHVLVACMRLAAGRHSKTTHHDELTKG
jgi:hypothetical protein